MPTTYETLQQHRNEILSLATLKGLCDVRVFGSVARGKETENSDIDLLVNVANTSDPFAFLDFQEAISTMFSHKVDLVFESGLYHAMRNKVLQEAKEI